MTMSLWHKFRCWIFIIMAQILNDRAVFYVHEHSSHSSGSEFWSHCGKLRPKKHLFHELKIARVSDRPQAHTEFQYCDKKWRTFSQFNLWQKVRQTFIGPWCQKAIVPNEGCMLWPVCVGDVDNISIAHQTVGQGSNKSAAVTASEGEAAQSQVNMNRTRTDTEPGGKQSHGIF